MSRRAAARAHVAAGGRRALRRTRIALGDDPRWLPVVLAATPTGRSRALTDRTQLVVEGFPRSGNTFAVYAFRLGEARAGRHLSVSSHVHTPSAVKAAVARGLPTVLVVRRPADALRSLLVAAPHVRPAAAVAEWLHHHEQILPVSDGYVVATFEQVVALDPQLWARVNARFGTAFDPLDGGPAGRDEVLAAIDRRHAAIHGGAPHVLPRPDAARIPALAEAGARLAAPTLVEPVARAEALYLRFEALARR